MYPLSRPRSTISPAVHRASRFQDLLDIPGGDGPYVFTRMFQESRLRERRRSAKRFRLLKRVDGTIREIVMPDEKVFFVTEGRGFSFWERWVLGWRRAIVLTDRRVVFLQLDAGRRPRLLHRQLAYGAITAMTERRSGTIVLGTGGGDRLELPGIHRTDRATVVQELRNGGKASTGMEAAAGIEKLCPYCHTNFSGRPDSCPSCLRRFRRGWVSTLSSLAIPGCGNFLIGYRGFALLEALIAIAVWAAFLAGPGVWGVPGVRSALGAACVFAAVHGADSALTWCIVRSGVFPARSG